MPYSFLPPLLKICQQNTLESYLPAAWKIHVHPPAWLSGKTTLRFGEESSPEDTNQQAAAEL